jgi:predicted tellurium resistance membrane protein TerC
MKRLGQLLDGLDAIELFVFGGMAAVMLIGGPLWLVADFVAKQRYLAAGVLGLLWIICIAVGVRDFRRKRFSWLTGGLFVGWFIATLLLSMG